MRLDDRVSVRLFSQPFSKSIQACLSVVWLKMVRIGSVLWLWPNILGLLTMQYMTIFYVCCNATILTLCINMQVRFIIKTFLSITFRVKLRPIFPYNIVAHRSNTYRNMKCKQYFRTNLATLSLFVAFIIMFRREKKWKYFHFL